MKHIHDPEASMEEFQELFPKFLLLVTSSFSYFYFFQCCFYFFSLLMFSSSRHRAMISHIVFLWDHRVKPLK